MAHLIDKDALVAEIENKRKHAQAIGDIAINSSMQQFFDGMKQGCVDILSFLDTFKVKEVDLEKEIDNYIFTDNGRQRLALELSWKQCNITFSYGKLIDFAKHFFELGLNAQKGE